jgi:NAD(P)-dependent dehydrogenase (short-subunit alcohol dehydrogenase family)
MSGDGENDDSEPEYEYDHAPVTVAGKRAVVIGATSGIGEAIALGFAADGADVIATSRTPEKVADTAAKLRAVGADTAEVTCDVTDPASVERLRDAAVGALGGVDVLVTSAGAIARRRVDEVGESEWHRVLDVQLNGVYRAIHAFAGEVESVVNVSSLAARIALAEAAAYSAAKGGVEALTRAAAKELAPDARVNAVAPGFVITPQNEETYAPGTEKRRRIDERTPMGRVAEREEIVGAAIYLASDAASFTTGDVVTVDGGFADGAL